MDLLGGAEDFQSSSDATDVKKHFEGQVSKIEETGVLEKATVKKTKSKAALREQYRQKKLLESEVERAKKEQWYVHLQTLLSRSQLYSKILTSKIEKQKQDKVKLMAKMTDVIEKADTKAGKRPELNVEDPPSKRRKFRSLYSPDQIGEVFSVIPQEPMETVDSTSVSRQPKSFVGDMREYQLEGMEWLKVLHDNGINGILADEMGLGKTIQVIALFAKLLEQNITGPFLVCGPLSTLGNWENELKRFTPHMKTLVYHGSKSEREDMLRSIRGKNVVITSYEIIMADKMSLQRFKWHYVVIDEGHRLKNPNCRFVDDLRAYRSDHRLLLTGTPLQNNLKELWSLLHFLMPYLFDDLKAFESWFDVSAMQQEGANAEIIAQEREKHIIDSLHQILTPFLLRRTKVDVNLDIPPKKEILIYARMSALEEKYYKATLNRSIGRLLGVDKENEPEVSMGLKRRAHRNVDYSVFTNESSNESDGQIPSNGTASLRKPESPVKKKVTSVTNLKMGSILMHLKKIVTHPYLLDYPLTAEGEYLVDENLIHNSGKLRVLDSLLNGLKRDGHKVLIFSQFTTLLDVLHDYCVFREYRFCRLDGSMKVLDRQDSVKLFQEDSDIFIFLLSTRAGGLGLNLIAADTVVIYDSDWNPQCDLQAQDRCHRFGQTKPVMVYRLVTANSVDEKVVTRAHAKRKLEKMIMMKGRFSGKDSPKNKGSEKDLIVEHLEDLLQNMDKQEKVLPQDGKVFTEAQLAMLLDRSGSVMAESTDLEPCFKVVNADLEDQQDV